MPASSIPGCCRRTWTIHALSLPLDHEIIHLVIWSSRHLVIVDQLANRASEEPGTEDAAPFDMSEQSEALKERTMCFSVTILRLIDKFQRSIASDVIARQLARSATSVAANYRSTCTAQSRSDFIAKLAIVVE